MLSGTGAADRTPAIVNSQSLRHRCLVGTLAGLLVVGTGLSMVSQVLSLGDVPLIVGWLSILLAMASIGGLVRWGQPVVMLLISGLAGLILLSAWWLRSASALSLLAICPVLVLIFYGWREATLCAILCAIAVIVTGRALQDALAGTVAILLLAVMTPLATVGLQLAEEIAQWAEARWFEGRRELDEAQDQRLRLKEVQQDLVQANTELARLTERLQAMRRVAEDSRRAKEEFVANVSHELRTPLNMIIGFAEIISEVPDSYGILPPRLLADIEVILNNSRHLSSLVDDVLDLSQAETGRMALSPRQVSVSNVVATAISTVSALFQKRGLWLRSEISPDLIAVCDEVRIRQVIVNLLSNAGRYTRKGGATVRAWTDKDALVISVEDTGSGIAPEKQEAVFEPFRRLEGERDSESKGSGLGLAISRRFVEMHGGEMWLTSQENQGSTFFFTLPLNGVPLPEPTTPTAGRWFNPYQTYEERQRPSSAPSPHLRPRFVIVERGEILRRLLARYQGDVEIVTAHTIDEAVMLCQRVPAQALIVNHPDLHYVHQHAIDPAELPYGVPVLTCWVPDSTTAAEELGVAEYMIKPLDRAQLLKAVSRVDLAGDTVLIVDDEPDAVHLLSRILSSAEDQIRTISASSGREALELMHRRRPGLVLLDLIMHGVDGYSVLRTKRDDPAIADIPVIAVSAQDPIRGPIASNYLGIARSGGLSTQELLSAISTVTALLSPPDRLDDPELGRVPAA